MIVTSYGGIKNLDDEIKNIAGQVLKNFEEFSLTKQKTGPGLDWKTYLDKIPVKKSKKKENQCQIAICEKETTTEQATLFNRFSTLV